MTTISFLFSVLLFNILFPEVCVTIDATYEVFWETATVEDQNIADLFPVGSECDSSVHLCSWLFAACFMFFSISSALISVSLCGEQSEREGLI